jgi:hypothetical protein
MVRGGC